MKSKEERKEFNLEYYNNTVKPAKDKINKLIYGNEEPSYKFKDKPKSLHGRGDNFSRKLIDIELRGLELKKTFQIKRGNK